MGPNMGKVNKPAKARAKKVDLEKTWTFRTYYDFYESSKYWT